MPPNTMIFFSNFVPENHRFAVTARGASGMVSFFPVLSQGTRAGKKDDTRLYKLPQTTLQPLSESTVALIIPFFGTCFSILTEGLPRFASKNDDLFFKPALCFHRFVAGHRLPAAARGCPRNDLFFPCAEPGYTRRKK